MPEVNQYTFALRELIETLIKKADVHEGHWSLVLGWQLGTGSYGPTSEQTFPGVVVTLGNLGIQRVAPGPLPEGPGVIIVDAAKANPAAPKVKKKS